MAGAVQALLWPSRAVAVAADLRARRLQRQRAEVDAGDAGAGDRAGRLSSVPTLHHACPVGGGARLAPIARRAAERRGVFILDGTSFPKQGPASVGVARQYCGALGKIANCQVAVTAALWTGVRAWCLGAALYLPEEWLTPRARQRARIPGSVRFQEKWRLALRLLRQTRAAGLTLTAVLADAEFGDVTTFRAALHRLRLPYALGISSHLTVFTTRPRVQPPAANRRGRPRKRWRMVPALQPVAVRALVKQLPRAALASHHVAQWYAAAADGSLRRRPRHPRARVATRATRARGLVAVRRRDRLEDAAQVLLRRPAGHRVVARGRAIGASTLGDRAAVPGTQERARARSFRRAELSGLAPSRRADRGRPCLHPTRAHAAHTWTQPDVSGRPRDRPGNLHGPVVCGQAAVHALDGTGETKDPTTDLTKSMRRRRIFSQWLAAQRRELRSVTPCAGKPDDEAKISKTAGVCGWVPSAAAGLGFS